VKYSNQKVQFVTHTLDFALFGVKIIFPILSRAYRFFLFTFEPKIAIVLGDKLSDIPLFASIRKNKPRNHLFSIKKQNQ